MPTGRVEEYVRHWGVQSVQRVLDSALAWSVINSHLDVADFLLQRRGTLGRLFADHRDDGRLTTQR
jgi:hypothetical protein